MSLRFFIHQPLSPVVDRSVVALNRARGIGAKVLTMDCRVGRDQQRVLLAGSAVVASAKVVRDHGVAVVIADSA